MQRTILRKGCEEGKALIAKQIKPLFSFSISIKKYLKKLKLGQVHKNCINYQYLHKN